MPLFLLFLLVPLIEIGLFIQVGGLIGLWPTLGIVVLTAIIGTAMIRDQGLRELAKLRDSLETLTDPSEPLANGAMILFAGALLLTPGFFTDTVGFLLLVPNVRRAVFSYIRARIKVQQVHMGARAETTRGSGGSGETVIDGEFHEVNTTGNIGDSGWTRH